MRSPLRQWNQIRTVSQRHEATGKKLRAAVDTEIIVAYLMRREATRHRSSDHVLILPRKFCNIRKSRRCNRGRDKHCVLIKRDGYTAYIHLLTHHP